MRVARWADLLRQRDFRLLWVGDAVSNVGGNVTQVALPLVAVLDLHAGAFLVGALAATPWLPWLLISLPAGAWVDRLPRRPVLLASNLGSLLLMLSVPVAAWCGVLTVPQLLLVGLLSGGCSVFGTTAYRVYLSTLLADPADLRTANAMIQGATSSGRLAGRGVGGLLAQWFGAVFGLVVDAASFAFAAVTVVLIRTREPALAPRAADSRLRAEIGAGLRFVFSDGYLRAFTLYLCFGNLAVFGFSAIQIPFLLQDLRVPPAAVGWLIACSSVGGLTGAVLSGRISTRLGTARGILVCELGGAPFDLLAGVATPGWGVLFQAVGVFVCGIGFGASNVMTNSFMQSYPPVGLRGKVTASGSLFIYGSAPIGGLLAGALGEDLGLRATVWIMMGTLVASGLFLLCSPIRTSRDLPATAGLGTQLSSGVG